VTGSLLEAASERVLVRNVVRATGPIARMVGLLGRTRMRADEGMWFDRCSSIHTLGMRMTIDVVFLDEEGVVVAVEAAVKPHRPWVAARGARSVLELAEGNAARQGIAKGMRLTVQWNSRTSS